MSLSDRTLLCAALAAWAVVAALNLITGAALGHDEAAFALVAHGDAPEWLYRSRGVALLADLGLAIGDADWQLRLASSVISLGVVLSVYAVGRAVFDGRTGAWAALVIAGAHPMAIRSAQLLGDLPATAALLAGLAVLIAELSRDGGPRCWLVLVAPAFATAFYFRYASAPVIAIAGLAALVLWWRAILARPLPVAATVAAFAVLMVPHALHSLQTTGAVLGVLRSSAGVPYRTYWGAGLVTYVTTNPLSYYGALVAPLLVIALVGLIRALRRRPSAMLVIVALGQLIALGIHTHAQPRYVFVATSLLVVLGVDTLRAFARPRPRLAFAACAAAWLALAIAVVPYHRSAAKLRAPMLAAASAIRADHAAHGGPRCLVVARQTPELMWYTRCVGMIAKSADAAVLAPGRDRYLISIPHDPLDGAAFAAARGVAIGELPTGNAGSRVWVVR